METNTKASVLALRAVLLELLLKSHNPELAAKSGMVYQIWQDGEITLQKSGELLWKRNLHCLWPGTTFKDDRFNLKKEEFPKTYNDFGYVFVAEKIKNNLLIKFNQYIEAVESLQIKVPTYQDIELIIEKDWDGYFERLVKSWIEDKKKEGKEFLHKVLVVTGAPFQGSAVTYIDNAEEHKLTLSFYPALRRNFGTLTQSDTDEIIEML